MTSVAPSFETRRRTIRLWLLAVAALIFVTVFVGGATRLTESGLSIVEWKPVTGVIPPFDVPAWQAEFEKYKTIPQYRERHPGMSLDEFKTIYWWEWTHRLLARLVDGALVPEPARLFFDVPLWRNFFENTLTVQFDHRMMAYALELIVLLHAVDVARTVRRGQALTGALALASAVTIQATLGIVTLVHQAPLALALLHQTMALVVLTIAVEHGKRLAREPIQVGAAAHDAATRHWGQAT